MFAKKFSLIIQLILLVALTNKLSANISELNLSSGDIIAIQGGDKNSFCFVNEQSMMVCNEKKKVTEKSLFKVKIINKENNILALSVGPDFNNYCQYDDSSKKIICDYEEEQPGSWEWFQFVPLNNETTLENKFALKSGTTGYRNYCGDQGGEITCDKNYIDESGTTFQYYILQKDSGEDINLINLAKIIPGVDDLELARKHNRIAPNLYLSATEAQSSEVINRGDNPEPKTHSKDFIQNLESHEKGTHVEKPIHKDCNSKNWENKKGKDNNLAGCDLKFVSFKGQNLKGWDFSHAKLNFTNFAGADLRGAKFDDAEMNNTNFKGANLKGAHFRGAKMTSVSFHKANMSNSKFEESSIEGSVFDNAILKDAYFILTTIKKSSFNKTNMDYVQMICDSEKRTFDQEHSPNIFHEVSFRKANLEHCNLAKTNLKNSDFYKADLAYVNFSGGNLGGSNFDKTNLSHSNFEKADLTKADFDDTVIFHTSFKDATLTKALFDTQYILESDFQGAKLNKTIFDDTIFIECKFQKQNLNLVVFKGKVAFLSSELQDVLFHKQDLTKIKLMGSNLKGAKLKLFTITFKNKSSKHSSKMCISYNSYDQKDQVVRGHVKCTKELKAGHHASIDGIPADSTHIRAMVYGDQGQNIGNRTWSSINEGKECTAKGILFEQAASCG